MQRFVLWTVFVGLLLISCRPAAPAPKDRVARSEQPDASAEPAPASQTPEETPSPPPGPTAAAPSPASGISAVDQEHLSHSWRQGCPVGPRDLRLLSVRFWGFDDAQHSGQIVVHAAQAERVIRVMDEVFNQRFPIERMDLVDKYQGDDDRSMEANNTSGFNCRDIAGRPGSWSQHAYGTAIDINPVQNPYVSASGEVSPSAGAQYLDRSQRLKGMIHPGDPVVRAFRSVGWKWGGDWERGKDYQHFSANGG